MERTFTTIGDPAQYHMDLAVTLAASTIQVGPGEVVLEGRTDGVPSQSIAIPVRATATVIFGYLAREVASDSLVLFVDEHVQDGIDEAYVFERGGPYRLIAYLFRITVPAGTSDLRAVDVDRWRIIPSENA